MALAVGSIGNIPRNLASCLLCTFVAIRRLKQKEIYLDVNNLEESVQAGKKQNPNAIFIRGFILPRLHSPSVPRPLE
jgi:hypothetical protein